MRYSKVPTDMDFVGREQETLRFWKEKDIVAKSLARGEEGTYTFYDGPPTANGQPHIGHVLTRAIKDLIPRYHAMKGAYVPRKAGWDTHGLPVELEVERALGIDGKEQIEAYGLAPFIARCKESVWKYKSMWERFSDAVAFWADMEHPYVTYHNDYIESEWWALKQIWDKGLLYKDFKIVPYCPRCGTPLSSHEVAQGYKTVKERSAVVRFAAADEENACFLAWTTTPWTLPSNTALCVNPQETYCKVAASDGHTYYLAEALVQQVLGGAQLSWQVVERMPGSALKGRPYRPLYDCAQRAAARQGKAAHYVTCDDYVTMSDGTGIVHIAPAFGEDDARIGRGCGLPFLQFVDARGRMTDDTPFAGLFVKEADPRILEDLKQRGLLFAAPLFEHDYPFCWRCDTPLLYYARESWYIRMTAVREDLIRNNDTVNWVPESIGKGRFGNWLANVQDWALSRNRYWGTPLNIWQCSCGHTHAVGSIAELRAMSPDCPPDIELHRPFIDAVTLRCPACGGQMHRVPEVVDCWFDSGSMPFAQYHYPFENQELFHRQFPAQFISEAVDQTRGWFYSLMAISTLLFNKAPFENVIVMGLVQDENGQKMSKSKGNAVEPMQALSTYGADAIRWYFYTNSAPWLPSRFHGKAVVEGQRRFMGTLWNTYAFYVLYANIDDFDPTRHTLRAPQQLGIMDRWLLSRLNSAVAQADKCLAAYAIPEACRALETFVDELSNWYVRRCRERYWAPGMPQDKIDAYMTLYTALVTTAKAAAPMIPFMTEAIYRNLVCSNDPAAPESVHLCRYPEVDAALIDPALEAGMAEVRQIVELGRSARNGARCKNRQPLAALYIKCPRMLDEACQRIVADELNVKQVLFLQDDAGLVDYAFKPQLKTLGPKYGRRLGEIRAALETLDGAAAKAALDAAGELTLPLADGPVTLSGEDVLITVLQRPGRYTVSDWGITVSLDIQLTPALLEEGDLRELISKVQTMRKEAGFEVTDHIRLTLGGSARLAALAHKYAGELCGATLCDELCAAADAKAEDTACAREWEINGEPVTLAVQRL